jgi:hypothetical protein
MNVTKLYLKDVIEEVLKFQNIKITRRILTSLNLVKLHNNSSGLDSRHFSLLPRQYQKYCLIQ